VVFEYLAADCVELDVPLDALGITQFDLINVFAIFLFQLGVGDGRIRCLASAAAFNFSKD
jgi:hypothetical protein